MVINDKPMSGLEVLDIIQGMNDDKCAILRVFNYKDIKEDYLRLFNLLLR